MRNFLNKKVAAVGALMATMVGMVNSASAALSTEISTGLSSIQTDGLALVDLVWPVVIAITSAFIIFKLFQRGVSKI